ncbi:MAG: Bax inhibitor-1/YccA family protein [Bacilli bacterium]|nr:Bax inhibitor-1/YccA family protein [Bacilli bacterium]MDD5182732.1 Bax inhibitor-1/YccA family protein [Bacilli bacterium]
MRIYNSNPAFKKINKAEYTASYEIATYKGIAKKTLFYLLLVLVGAFGGLFLIANNPPIGIAVFIGSFIVSLISGLIALMIPKATKIAGSIYCLFQGIFVGVISMTFAAETNGIVPAALLGVITVFLIVTTLYVTRIVKVTNKFMNFLFIFAISFIITMVALYLFSIFGQFEFSLPIMALISGISVILATFYLFMDLEQIRMVVEGGYPKEYEWHSAFALSYTLIWLYIELLRLIFILSRIFSRD